MKILATNLFVERSVADLDWVLYILVTSMALVAIGRVLFNNNFESLNKFEKFQEVNDNQRLFGLLFQFVFALLISALALNYFTEEYDSLLNTPLLKVVFLSSCILLFFGIRSILGKVASFAFGISHDRSFNAKAFNYFRVHSVALLWVGVLLFYFSSLHQLILAATLLFFLLLIRIVAYYTVMNHQEVKQSKIWYYNILYLCALEILPLLVLFKFLNIW